MQNSFRSPSPSPLLRRLSPVAEAAAEVKAGAAAEHLTQSTSLCAEMDGRDEVDASGMELAPQPQEEGIPPDMAVQRTQEQQWRETRYGRWQQEQHSKPGLGLALLSSPLYRARETGYDI